MKRQIVITSVLEFGGSNSYLKNLLNYLGKENVLVVVESSQEISLLNKLFHDSKIQTKILPRLLHSPDFKKASYKHNLRQAYYFLWSLFVIFLLSARNRFAGVSVSVIDPEKYLYLFWLPFIKVRYILHTEPLALRNRFSSATCNIRLANKRKIITVSNANRRSIISTWRIVERASKHVLTIYNCLVPGKAVKHGEVVGRGYAIVLTMGHVADYKNPYLWLDVAKRVVTVRDKVLFYWLGNGQLFQFFLDETKNNDKIQFVGYTEDPDSFLRKAAIYYQPSLLETQGIAVIEAMANKLPCVVSNIGGLPESIVHEKNGYVVSPHDVEQNVNAILNLVDNPELCKSYGEASYERYLQLFGRGKFISEMDKIYLS